MSSLSINKVRNRALNANTQNTNNFSMWMEPLSHQQYPVTEVHNATANAVITSNGTRNGIFAQPGMLYNNLRLDVSGSVIPTRWAIGQTINTVFLQSADISQINTQMNSTSFVTIATYTYTPKSTTSKIIVEYDALYFINGDVVDSFESQITIDGTTAAKRQQFFNTTNGGSGTRGGTLFPISGAVPNTAITPRVINIVAKRVSGDDYIQFYSASFDAFMKITEIGA